MSVPTCASACARRSGPELTDQGLEALGEVGQLRRRLAHALAVADDLLADAVDPFDAYRDTLGGGALLGATLGGAAFGALVGPMIGIPVPNSRLTQLEEAVETGQFLVVVDVPKKDIEAIIELVTTQYPKVTIEGVEPEPSP